MTSRLARGAIWPRLARRAAAMRSDPVFAFLDLALVTAAYLGVLILRFNGKVPSNAWHQFAQFLPFALAVHLAANWTWGLYGQLWRYASVQEARRIILAGSSSVVVLL